MPPDSRFHTQRLTQAPLYELSWFWVREVGGPAGDPCAPGAGVYRAPEGADLMLVWSRKVSLTPWHAGGRGWLVGVSWVPRLLWGKVATGQPGLRGRSSPAPVRRVRGFMATCDLLQRRSPSSDSNSGLSWRPCFTRCPPGAPTLPPLPAARFPWRQRALTVFSKDSRGSCRTSPQKDGAGQCWGGGPRLGRSCWLSAGVTY